MADISTKHKVSPHTVAAVPIWVADTRTGIAWDISRIVARLLVFLQPFSNHQIESGCQAWLSWRYLAASKSNPPWALVSGERRFHWQLRMCMRAALLGLRQPHLEKYHYFTLVIMLLMTFKKPSKTHQKLWKAIVNRISFRTLGFILSLLLCASTFFSGTLVQVNDVNMWF